jgi:hypothetical protein
MKKRPSPTKLPSLTKKRVGPEVPRAAAEPPEVIHIRNSKDKQELLLDGVYSGVHEFLVKKGLWGTVESLEREMLGGKDEAEDKAWGEELLSLFDEGKRDEFLGAWRRFIPASLRRGDEVTIKLEFFLHLYFGIFPVHPALHLRPLKPSQPPAKSALDNFKQYLARQAHELSKLPELLTYFALTMVKDPLSNPTFSRIFTREWVSELRNQLVSFIESMYSPASEPFLVHLYREYMEGRHKQPMASPDDEDIDNYRKDYLSYVAELETNNTALVDIVDEFKDKCNRLEEYIAKGGNNQSSVEIQQKWALFSNEILTMAKRILKSLKEGRNQVEITREYEAKLSDFDRFLSINMKDLSMERQTPPSNLPPTPIVSDKRVLRFPAIDFARLKEHLKVDGEDDKKVVLLGGLKMRIARGDILGRRQTIAALANADLFELESELPPEDRVYRRLLVSEAKVKAEALKLFNLVCTNNVSGRGYLTKQEDFIELLIDILTEENSDSKVRRRTLGILQNLSLRKNPQQIMIHRGLVPTCFRILRNERSTLSTYSLDYFTALLMNLCLRQEGREQCELLDFDIFEVLGALLQFQSNQVWTFVNGLLFSILTSKKLKVQAKESGFLQKLKALKPTISERFQKQIDCIIEQAEKEENPLAQSFEEDTQGDQVEDDDCCDEDISIGDDQGQGERALRQECLADPDEEARQAEQLKTISAQRRSTPGHSQNNFTPLDRPTTPAMVMGEGERAASAQAWAQSNPKQERQGSANEGSIVYGNQNVAVETIPEDKRQKVLLVNKDS